MGKLYVIVMKGDNRGFKVAMEGYVMRKGGQEVHPTVKP
jgi:hypothetical protein